MKKKRLKSLASRINLLYKKGKIFFTQQKFEHAYDTHLEITRLLHSLDSKADFNYVAGTFPFLEFLSNLQFLTFRRGDYEATLHALRVMETYLGFYDEGVDPRYFAIIAANRGKCYRKMGDLPSAVASLEEANDLMDEPILENLLELIDCQLQLLLHTVATIDDSSSSLLKLAAEKSAQTLLYRGIKALNFVNELQGDKIKREKKPQEDWELTYELILSSQAYCFMVLGEFDLLKTLVVDFGYKFKESPIYLSAVQFLRENNKSLSDI